MKLFILLSFFVSICYTQTYPDTVFTAKMFCDMKSCQGQSVACEYIQDSSTKCDGKIIDLNIEDVVKRHNELRQKIASGQLNGFESASRMSEVKWNNELAQMALYNVKRCKFEHTCSSTTNFPMSGQNIAILTGDVNDISSTITGLVDMWFNEHKNADMNVIKQLPADMNLFLKVGHFTQMVQEKNADIGCAAIKYGQKFLMTCNYGYGNLSPLYIPGPSASKCSVKSSTFNALCSVY